METENRVAAGAGGARVQERGTREFVFNGTEFQFGKMKLWRWMEMMVTQQHERT